MSLTPTQLQALKADIDANSGEFGSVPMTPDGHQAIAEAYNQQATPDFYVWRTSIDQSEINEAVDWAEVVGLTTNELLAFSILKDQDTINAADVSIRGAFNAIFPSNQQPNSNAALVAVAKRLALRIEAVLSNGTGSEASPATMGYEGPIDRFDVEKARLLP